LRISHADIKQGVNSDDHHFESCRGAIIGSFRSSLTGQSTHPTKLSGGSIQTKLTEGLSCDLPHALKNIGGREAESTGVEQISLTLRAGDLTKNSWRSGRGGSRTTTPPLLVALIGPITPRGPCGGVLCLVADRRREGSVAYRIVK